MLLESHIYVAYNFLCVYKNQIIMNLKNGLLIFFTLLFLPNLSAQNVGIGEPNPSEKLEVNGRIAAKGYKNSIFTAVGANTINVLEEFDWIDVDGLSVTFTLDEPTTVMISSKVHCRSYSLTLLLGTRLLVDGTEYDPTKNRMSNAIDRMIHNDHILELGAGTHTIEVQWRIIIQGTGWFSDVDANAGRKLQVLVFGEAN